MNIIPNPNIETLKKHIEVLKNELTNIISDYELLINFTCRNIKDIYMTLIGYSRLELLEIECEARRLKRKFELMQKYINRGLPIDIQLIENNLNKEMEEWTIKINKYIKELKQSELNITLMEMAPDNTEVKKLFRKLSKILHPDINPYLPEYYKLLWFRVYEAYKICDINELKTIELMIEMDNIVPVPEKVSTIDELLLKENKLEESISHYIKKIETVKNTNPYKFIEIIENEEFLTAELGAIEKQKEHFRKQIDKYIMILKNINTGNHVEFGLN